MQDLPTGTITFLFTDIEGSTALWEKHPDPMRTALARHDALMREIIERGGGYVVKSTGDGAMAAFRTASSSVSAALALQLALDTEPWPEPVKIRVRMGLHTDSAEVRDGDYFGPAIHRTARLMSAGHGGQVLLSAATSRLAADALPAGVFFRDLGRHRLKDLQQPEHVFQLCHSALADDFRPLKSLNGALHNLPVQLTQFVGREADTVNVKALLARLRLLTLTAPGGMGKTRLSLHVAVEVVDNYADGVWLVELAPISDPALVVKAVASALSVREDAGRSPIGTLTEALKARTLLLLLDNCEHVLDAVAAVADSLLKACPHVHILATSRQGLGVGGEQIYRIPALTLPRLRASDDAAGVGDLMGSEAVRLFADRASLVNASFAVSTANGPALRRLCHQLDGIPLALELAAARVRSLPVEQIESRLKDRFRLLTGGSRTALPRQQTLRALIDWSYDLLNDRERALLQRLSLFAGGWTIAAAETICAAADLESWEILDILMALVDKSLALYDQSEGAGRYRLLETVKQYAHERLNETGDREKFQTLHRDYYLGLAEEMGRKVLSPDSAVAFRTLETEHENLRMAIDFAMAVPDGAQTALRLGAAMARFWWTRDHQIEGRARLEKLLALPGADAPTRPRAFVLNSLVALCWLQGDAAFERERLEESLAISKAGNDKLGIAVSRAYLGNHNTDRGHYEIGRALLEESLGMFRELGNQYLMAMPLTFLGLVARILSDRGTARTLFDEGLALARSQGAPWWVVQGLVGLSLLAQDEGDFSAATAYLEEALEVCGEVGDRRSRSFVLAHLGRIRCFAGDHVAAEQHLKECMEICRHLGNRPETALGLEGYALLASRREQLERAAVLWSAAGTLRGVIERVRTPFAQARHDEESARLGRILGADRLAVAQSYGAALGYEAAVAYALASTMSQ